ncbi:MAG: rubredoxin [Proteobacteria bacterium]|nr:rubredoxin [Pseudomonadota bacterium]MBU1639765.1 rubredoxin [Pseudomonadota bacterium]
MEKYQCPCGYVYDPAKGDPVNGVSAGTAFHDLPAEWCCPLCGVEKDFFKKLD